MEKLGRLNHFKDSATQCYANVTLADGAPVFVSVADSGVRIKRSKFGILGEKLFDRDFEFSSDKALRIIGHFGAVDWLPVEMTNTALRAFTQLAMGAPNIEKLRDALK